MLNLKRLIRPFIALVLTCSVVISSSAAPIIYFDPIPPICKGAAVTPPREGEKFVVSESEKRFVDGEGNICNVDVINYAVGHEKYHRVVIRPIASNTSCSHNNKTRYYTSDEVRCLGYYYYYKVVCNVCSANLGVEADVQPGGTGHNNFYTKYLYCSGNNPVTGCIGSNQIWEKRCSNTSSYGRCDAVIGAFTRVCDGMHPYMIES